MWIFWVQTPLRPGTRCWVLHPGYNFQVVGEAKAGVNNKSRSQQTQLVSRCKDGQQYILFKKIYRHDTPLIFPNDPHIGTNKMCDSVVWSPGNPGQWVRWWCRYLIDMASARPVSNVWVRKMACGMFFGEPWTLKDCRVGNAFRTTACNYWVLRHGSFVCNTAIQWGGELSSEQGLQLFMFRKFDLWTTCCYVCVCMCLAVQTETKKNPVSNTHMLFSINPWGPGFVQDCMKSYERDVCDHIHHKNPIYYIVAIVQECLRSLPIVPSNTEKTTNSMQKPR